MYKVSIDDLIGVLSFDMYKWYKSIGQEPAYPGKVIKYRVDKTFYGFIYYGKLDEEQACNVQMEQCYHPAGYGFYSYDYDPQYDITTWKCSTSCD
jgi:hypothetical protein